MHSIYLGFPVYIIWCLIHFLKRARLAFNVPDSIRYNNGVLYLKKNDTPMAIELYKILIAMSAKINLLWGV